MGQAWCKERTQKVDDSKSPIDRVFVRCAHRIYPSLKGEGSSLGTAQRVSSSEIGYVDLPPRAGLLRGRSIDSVDRPFHPSEWVDVNLEVPCTPMASVLHTDLNVENCPKIHRTVTNAMSSSPKSNNSFETEENATTATPVPPPRKRKHREKEAVENAITTSKDDVNENKESINENDTKVKVHSKVHVDEDDDVDKVREISDDFSKDSIELNNSRSINEETSKLVRNPSLQEFSINLQRSLAIADQTTRNQLLQELKQNIRNRSAEEISSSQLQNGKDDDVRINNKRPKNHSTTSLPNYDELLHVERHTFDEVHETIREEDAKHSTCQTYSIEKDLSLSRPENPEGKIFSVKRSGETSDEGDGDRVEPSCDAKANAIDSKDFEKGNSIFKIDAFSKEPNFDSNLKTSTPVKCILDNSRDSQNFQDNYQTFNETCEKIVTDRSSALEETENFVIAQETSEIDEESKKIENTLDASKSDIFYEASEELQGDVKGDRDLGNEVKFTTPVITVTLERTISDESLPKDMIDEFDTEAEENLENISMDKGNLSMEMNGVKNESAASSELELYKCVKVDIIDSLENIDLESEKQRVNMESPTFEFHDSLSNSCNDFNNHKAKEIIEDDSRKENETQIVPLKQNRMSTIDDETFASHKVKKYQIVDLTKDNNNLNIDFIKHERMNPFNETIINDFLIPPEKPSRVHKSTLNNIEDSVNEPTIVPTPPRRKNRSKLSVKVEDNNYNNSENYFNDRLI